MKFFKNWFDRRKNEPHPYLSPCPFCGSKNVATRKMESGGSFVGYYTTYYVMCLECQAEGFEACSSFEEAEEKWENRNTETKILGANRRTGLNVSSCPFCDEDIAPARLRGGWGMGGYFMECMCGTSGPLAPKEEPKKAVELWNTRAKLLDTTEKPDTIAA